MTAIVVSGPEKAGKSTFCSVLAALARERGLQVYQTHFSGSQPAMLHDIAALVQLGSEENTLVVWDRSWACGAVYKKLGFSQRPEAVLENGEELAGDWIRRHGTTLMLLGPGPAALRALRTPDDLPVDPGKERLAFLDYALLHGWEVAENAHTEDAAADLARRLLERGPLVPARGN